MTLPSISYSVSLGSFVTTGNSKALPIMNVYKVAELKFLKLLSNLCIFVYCMALLRY